MVDLFKVKLGSGGGGGEPSEVPTTGGCPLLWGPTYLIVVYKPEDRILIYKLV